jgi:hypothetical protein
MYGPPEIEVAQYRSETLDRFRQKISQFPPETVFAWCTDRDGGGLSQQQSKLHREVIKQIAESQGFRFLAQQPSGSCRSDITGS